MNRLLSSSAALRCPPRQARSQQRLQQILDAALAVLSEVGYEGMTTEAIALRAGTSKGSVYRFFPDRAAVFAALTERWAAHMRQLFATAVGPDAAQMPLAEFVTRTIDVLDRFYTSQPEYQAIPIQVRLSPELQGIYSELNRELAQQLAAFFALRQADLPLTKRTLMAQVSVEMVSAVQLLSFTQEPVIQQEMVNEIKSAIFNYLKPHFEPELT
ncbi:TetR/AcrR family transcriptional regulator [Leptolyngbya sp. FACHB-261]|uniref:TetR/AcrR family transcriptional regulator n=1 Tax=Leptolyngbya sp. FACHB-261 TaxID=2692806 RepID=UPI0016879180|nr:TetR/AcrR family transcriptional regulator [Leptolyngbya sp. FACHB-261]MBD2101050.1 TetR family transcriptional regulator [Leptolyngbya sp. FACHB-261]